ncbi:FAD-binding oxidoreductase [Actibacterium sp. 188UL27-1]|uniref:NAD(P)/FAD-dependent oxidoreductase n=1 Tax=Actibacterium sp. 188UL27-1 TaxID=2786961 RepID=UPI00195E73BD|nr:FAD-binding oxidoreductase [Actibacterium sp. 188UL27-1]MBM7068293.1 FAD-binding oxidoreductase [Actibacterium sp. 188UL27-1]
MDLLTANDQPGVYPASYYAATTDLLPLCPVAQGDLTCDVAVVGGGYTGLSAALHLAERGYDVVLLEAQRVGFGASGRNGGQVATGQRLDQEALEDLVGTDEARRLWELSLSSVDLVHDLCDRHGIACDWQDGLIEALHTKGLAREASRYPDHMATQYGYTRMRNLDRAEMREAVESPAYVGGVLDEGSGHLHPLKYALGLARAALNAGVRVFEQSRVSNLVAGDPVQLTTTHATVTARHVLLAANGYLGDLAPAVAAYVMPINNFIVATAKLDNPEALIARNRAVADSKFVLNYFRRSADGRLLFGGGESYGYRFPRDIARTVRRPLAQIFPQLAKIPFDYAWGGTLAITMSRLPHVTRLRGNILSASGFSGHGVALGTLAGQIMAETVAGQAERFDLMARQPTGRFFGGAALRHPLLVLAMLWYGLRDRL